MNISDKLLEIKKLTKTYGTGTNTIEALKGVDISIFNGEFIGIMGASGSGKTTLLNCIGTMSKSTSGEILLDNMDITRLDGKELYEYRGKKIGYLFQEYELLDNLTVEENIVLPLAIHGESVENRTEKLSRISKLLEIEEILYKFPSEISGGEKQRVAAARALITKPKILLADEPTGALDSKNAKNLMNRLQNINEDELMTILMVTHDANVASYCSRILFIQDGFIFHDIRREYPKETQDLFYERIIKVMAQLSGGSANVL